MTPMDQSHDPQNDQILPTADDQPGDDLHTASLHPRLAWMMCYNETKSAEEVCRRFGISKKTFYKWFKRYQASNGESASLFDRSKRPHTFPSATPE